MKKPNVVCPACKEVRKQETTGNWVVLCGIIFGQYVKGESNYKNYTIVPSNCEESNYTKCNVWREDKEAGWARNHDYSSLQQREQIRV
jgi:hypothetical protein